MKLSSISGLRVTLLAAKSRNGVIGKEGSIPWHIKEDFKHFKEFTSGEGKVIIMGRKTYDSLPGHKLLGRRKIVLSSTLVEKRVNLVVVKDIYEMERELLFLTDLGVNHLVVIGGGLLYTLFMPIADEIVLTEIDVEIEGDTYFPEIDLSEFGLTSITTLTKEAEVCTYRRFPSAYRSNEETIKTISSKYL